MKLLKNILMMLFGGVALSGCSDIDIVTASDKPTTAVLAPYSLPIEITEQTMGDKLIFDWSAANFGYDAAVTYSLYGVIDGSEPGVIATVNATHLEITQKDFNRAVLAIGAKGNEESNISLYVEAYINESFTKTKSNFVNVSVTAFRIDFAPALYVPGSHQGWAPASAPALTLTNEEDGIYDGFLNLPDANTLFKFTAQRDWDPDNWGGTLAKLEYKSGDNITELVEAGFFRMTVNLPKLKATPLKVNTIGLIGDATPNGWDGDTPLVQDGYTWKASVAMTAGNFKVRFNNDWGFVLGGDMSALSPTGGNVPFTTSGTYDVVLDLASYPWTITFTSK